ncbi:hypothetical protein OG400_02210 [Micromonospora ureilytica]|uniref:hypothetical protein n=1 Tax=Micromonospora TaxID=1873 RepID=UPI002E12385D|nr:hypothetical protein OG400_02210 [Micromonospora ureilytica]WSZ76524.1 hypothetical protein OH804_32470 [Micromonospora sp. NBC_00860]
MDRFEGRCWLDWWANSSTLFGSAEVTAVITASDAGWEAHGRLVGEIDEERDGFAFLCDLDPVFTLRFEDGSTFDVTVHAADDQRRFTLTEYTGPVHRPVNISWDGCVKHQVGPDTCSPVSRPA